MSQYYEVNNRDAQACSFAGNGTINALAPSSTAANAVASSCIATPSATFTPTAPSGGSGASSTGSSGTGNGGGSSGSAKPSIGSPGLYIDIIPLVVVSVMGIISIVGGVWTLF